MGLARNEISDEMEVYEAPTLCPSASPPPFPVPPSSQDKRAGEAGAQTALGCTEIGDIDMVDVAVGDADEAPVVIAAGMTTAQAVEAIAEAAGLGATGPPSASPSRHFAVSPSRPSNHASPSQDANLRRSVAVTRIETSPRIDSPSRNSCRVADVDVDTTPAVRDACFCGVRAGGVRSDGNCV